MERLVDRLLDYKALVRHCGPDEVAATVAAALGERGVRSVVVPAGLEPGWLEALDGEVTVHVDEGQLTVAELDARRRGGHRLRGRGRRDRHPGARWLGRARAAG